jgi:GH25 family lysozyme M1 (1,4-beta-N-acetylmuramidase)
MKFLAVFALAVLSIGAANAQSPGSCYTFYSGLCPGPSNCMCTLGESCGSRSNMSVVRNAAGGCSGSCRYVNYGQCGGGSDCLQDNGSCDGSGSGSGSNPNPPPPPPPPPPSSGGLGGDISDAVSQSTFSCAVQNGWSYTIVRSYCSYGGVDSNAPANLQAASAAGLTTDVYHFPCAFGVSASQQVSDDYNQVKGQFGTMWFDIETNPSSGCGWQGDTSSNCNFLGQMISAAQSLGISAGIYSSSYMWSSIMGSSCTVGADNGVPLWYAHYDNNPSFSDFSGFGGWTSPTMKQYWDSVGYCGLNADADYK